VERALLVGWSYGAVVAAHWASRNPDRTLGAVLVDGAFPHDWLDEAMEQRIRKLFQRMGWFMPLLRPTGLVPRMNAEQQADSNIELGVLSREAELGPVLDTITVPLRYVIASGTSFGSEGDEQEQIRAGIVRKDFNAIADAVREVDALDHEASGDLRRRNLERNLESYSS
jgi:pimeloyl-ACP methyl ester carboxylesterase